MNLVTPGSLTTTIRGIRQADATKPIVLLEGGTDHQIYKNHFGHPDTYQHVVCNGKSNLLTAYERLQETYVRNILAICDADYDRVLSHQLPPGVVLTDLHDSEMLAFASKAYERVVAELLYSVGQYSVDEALKVSNATFTSAQAIGRLRIYNQRTSAQLNFKSVDAAAFALRDWNWASGDYVQSLLENSPASTLSLPEALAAMNRDDGTELPDLVNGHDLASLTDAFTRIPYGERAVLRDDVEQLLRVALWPGEFQATRMYSLIAAWESQNSVDILT